MNDIQNNTRHGFVILTLTGEGCAVWQNGTKKQLDSVQVTQECNPMGMSSETHLKTYSGEVHRGIHLLLKG